MESVRDKIDATGGSFPTQFQDRGLLCANPRLSIGTKYVLRTDLIYED